MYERRLPLERIQTLSPRYFVLTYRCPEIAAAARPGQFVMIAAASAIDPLLRRPMAVYRVIERDGRPDAFALLVESHGRGTRLMSRFRPGDEAAVLGPLGRPFVYREFPDHEHLLVMGGVGAAPFPLLAGAMVASGLRVRAFVGGRTVGDLLCVEDFEALGVPVATTTDDGSAGHPGLVTEALEAHLARESGPSRLYSCGPTPMMAAVDRIARREGIAHQVSLEAPMACGIGVCLSCVVRVGSEESWTYQRICREGPVFDARRLVWG